MNKVRLYLAIAGLCWLGGCLGERAGTGVGNPGEEVEAQFAMNAMQQRGSMMKRGAASDTDLVLVDGSGILFHIKEVRVNVRDVQFELPDGVDCVADNPLCNDSSLVLEGPFVMDLMLNQSSPRIPVFKIPQAEYKRVDVRMDDSREEDGLLDTDDVLLNNTLIIRGLFDYDGVSDRTLIILLKFNEDARFEHPDSKTLIRGEVNVFTVELVVSQWLAGIDIGTCLENGELVFDSAGDLRIDENGCNDIENTLKENIKNSGVLD